MDDEQLKKANKLKSQKSKILDELKIWEKELTSANKLGYLQGWNSNHPVELETSMSAGIFDGFRCAAMDNLKLKLVAINKQFEEI